jgi:lipopolysaccharide biosynthesis glycosyltransferase
MTSETFYLAYACDKEYVEHVMVSLCSIFENNPQISFIVYIVNTDIDPSLWSKITTLVSKYGHQAVDSKIEDFELNKLPTGNHFSKANYYRLFLQERVLQPRVLYLDADTIVVRPIDELYNIDVSDAFVAAVADYGVIPHRDLNMSSDTTYFNSGMMLINLDAWRSFDVKGKVIELVGKVPWAIQFVDQCGLNAIINGKWKRVPLKFNAQVAVLSIFYEDDTNPTEQHEWAEALSSPVIIHYSGPIKPWHFRFNHPSKDIYRKYLKKTPYARRFSKDLTLVNLIKWCIPLPLKLLAKRWMQNVREAK